MMIFRCYECKDKVSLDVGERKRCECGKCLFVVNRSGMYIVKGPGDTQRNYEKNNV